MPMYRAILEGRRERAREGAAAVEFALVGPILILLLIGIVVYGGWFLTAQTVQAVASEGARAAIGGLDAVEREALVRSEVTGAVRGVALNPDRTTILVTEEAGRLRVVVAYDSSDTPLMLMGGMLPRPPAVIRRVAVIQVGDPS
ncbi:MAG: TadE/TadG family type IV pilus assembly protein [Candidatus Brevundimonas colombiensis]|jgi:Flp pilus assembly protein TadG|uniref:TadE/TadG family type IV pilus assembly protein n=1 Tax=Candidatus Brevundimonas colombiensis TaxID=3121376 RepID=A0AAJ5X282_9CAUL|nr:TadE/TadG family type IV pilus assembly protein [Brevundimonas sp.]WEK40679.1 MAG: TadE/TadG family type IV pilus assembly protein [Brevundimonas sp.]